MLKAVIFDMDGVVADSHPIHEAAWKTLLLEEGLAAETLDLDFLYAGHPRRAILKHYLGELDQEKVEALGRRKDELYLLEAERLLPKPGIPELLNELQSAGIKLGLATSAGRIRTQDTLLKFGMTRRFSVVITGEEVAKAKPAPDIFLLTAKRLGILPAESIVFEDSVAGVQAARAAEMRCVGFAPEKWLADLREAGADPAISEIPANGAEFCRALLEPEEFENGPLVSANFLWKEKE